MGQSPRKISAKSVLADIRSGMDDHSMMVKYKISEKGLHSLFLKLFDAALLEKAELQNRGVQFTSEPTKKGLPHPTGSERSPSQGIGTGTPSALTREKHGDSPSPVMDAKDSVKTRATTRRQLYSETPGHALLNALLFRFICKLKPTLVKWILRVGGDANSMLGNLPWYASLLLPPLVRSKRQDNCSVLTVACIPGSLSGVIAKRETALKIIDLLLQAGADVHRADGLGDTPVIAACRPVEALMNPDKGGYFGMIGMIGILHGTWRGFVKMAVENLLSRGASINDPNSKGETALMMSAMASWDVMVECLIEQGSDIDAKDNEGNTALIRAVRQYCFIISKLGIRYITEISPGGITKVYMFVPKSDPDRVKYEPVGASGPRIIEFSLANDVPLEFCPDKLPYQFRHLYDCIRLLLSLGANRDVRNSQGYSAIDYAVEHTREDLVKILNA